MIAQVQRLLAGVKAQLAGGDWLGTLLALWAVVVAVVIVGGATVTLVWHVVAAVWRVLAGE